MHIKWLKNLISKDLIVHKHEPVYCTNKNCMNIYGTFSIKYLVNSLKKKNTNNLSPLQSLKLVKLK